MSIARLLPRFTKPLVAVLLGLMLLGGGVMLLRGPVRGYVVTCTKAQQIHCVVERETSDGMQTSQVPLGADAAAVVRVEPRGRSGSRVFLYLTSASREVFAAEYEGGSAIADAQAAAAKLDRVFASRGTATERIVARPPAYLRWLAWGGLGVMALLVLAVYRELFGREGTTARRIAALLVIATPATVHAQQWTPAPGHRQVALWPRGVPDSQPARAPESVSTAKNLVAGRPWTYIENVSVPTITVYSPTAKLNTHAAMLVFPGGGYQILAIDLEGTEVCDWLVSRGITCVLLKYRVPNSGPHWDAKCRCHVTPHPLTALQDAQRAIGLVRAHAAEWQVDPRKVGVIGFSAGGHLVAATSNDWRKRIYRRVDAADDLSARPDFAIGVYPGHLWESDTSHSPIAFNPDLHVTRQTPPTFLVQAETDSVDNVNQSLAYYVALKHAGVPVEMHLYVNGGHAFGLRRTKDPITEWPLLVERWLGTIGVLGAPAGQ